MSDGVHSRFKHGKVGTPAYRSWKYMNTRCHNQNNSRYLDYGGRGIIICERWRTFANFLADMGERPEGKSLDRIDNDGNYEPGNCRWATQVEQNTNARHVRPVVRSDGKHYPSQAAAAKEMECNTSDIALVCKGIRYSAKGYGWRYE